MHMACNAHCAPAGHHPLRQLLLAAPGMRRWPGKRLQRGLHST
eukprot:COSAG06_NODE_10617_length_1648_cov_1.302776_1_plen_42_part_10